MLDITGNYDLHDGLNMGLTIRGVDGSGALQNSFIRTTTGDTIPITGTFDPTTKAIAFSTAHSPGEILFVTFYNGFAILDPKAVYGVYGFAGTWHSQTIHFEREGRKKVLKLVNNSGGWVADNHQVPP
jgi:hypothetical protein